MGVQEWLAVKHTPISHEMRDGRHKQRAATTPIPPAGAERSTRLRQR